jgi:hypothetical protein
MLMPRSFDEAPRFDVRIWNITNWFELTQEEFVQIMGNDLGANLQLLMDILDALDARNPADHAGLICEWCRNENGILGGVPAQALKSGRLHEVLAAARQAELVEPEVDWTELNHWLERRLRKSKKS